MSEKDISEINIIYEIIGENINIFGYEFVKNNKDKCTMITDNKEYKITQTFKVKNIFNSNIKIKLKGIDNITNMSSIFNKCYTLSSLIDISKWNTNNITNMSWMFNECLLLSSLPDISNWNTNNVTDMNHMFSECRSLSSLPDISK